MSVMPRFSRIMQGRDCCRDPQFREREIIVAVADGELALSEAP
jgi:hypothetical protein